MAKANTRGNRTKTTKKKQTKKPAKKPASKRYADGTTYKDSKGKTHRRVSKPGTPDGQAYCARSNEQKKTEKVKVRRKAWGCKGKKSKK